MHPNINVIFALKQPWAKYLKEAAAHSITAVTGKHAWLLTDYKRCPITQQVFQWALYSFKQLQALRGNKNISNFKALIQATGFVTDH